MRHLICFVVAAVAFASAAIAAPKTIYVDKNVASSGDGTSWASAFKTIQEGVNNASATEVDTVLVAPGEYGEDQGTVSVTASSKTQLCRVNITKKLILKSRDGKETTHIVGRRGNGSGGNDAQGNEPVMCVLIKNTANNNAVGATVEGFTIRDGEMSSTLGDVGPAGVGNPFFPSYTADYSNYFYVAYCTVSNCCAQRRSAMRGGTAISTLFADNTAWGKSTIGQSAGEIYAYNCIFTRAAGTAVCGAYAFANCTVCNNSDERGATCTDWYNSASFDNGTAGDNTVGKALSCVFDGTAADISEKTNTTGTVTVGTKCSADTSLAHSRLCMAACAGDFRPVAGGYLYGLDGHYGKIEYTNLDFIPPEYKQRDFYGRKLDDDEVIPIGVILPAATPAAKPLRIPSANVSINGSQCKVAGQFVNSESAHGQLVITPVLGAKEATFSITYDGQTYFPRRDGTYLYTFRSPNGSYSSLAHSKAAGVYYVDRVNGSDGEGNDGSSTASAFQSLQHAIDSLPATGNYVVRVAEGTYDNESGHVDKWTGSYTGGGRARVAIERTTEFGLLLWAMGDRDRTVIEGELDDVNGAESNGVGPNAMRCMIVKGKASCRVGVSGFTFRKGRPTGETNATDCRGGVGGAVISMTQYNTVLQDCAFTKNAALTGSAVQNVACLRCRFFANETTPSSAYNAKSIINASIASSCLFEGNPDDLSLCSPSIASRIYNCTVYGSNQNSSLTYAYTTSSSITNSIVCSQAVFPDINAGNGGALGGNIFWVADESQIRPTEGYVRANPKLANAGSGDYRLNWNSPAWKGGTEFTDDMAAYIVGDYYGNPIRFTDDGKVVVGAVHALGKERTGFVISFQ